MYSDTHAHLTDKAGSILKHFRILMHVSFYKSSVNPIIYSFKILCNGILEIKSGSELRDNIFCLYYIGMSL